MSSFFIASIAVIALCDFPRLEVKICGDGIHIPVCAGRLILAVGREIDDAYSTPCVVLYLSTHEESDEGHIIAARPGKSSIV